METAAMATVRMSSPVDSRNISDMAYSDDDNATSLPCVNTLLQPDQPWFWIDLTIFTLLTFGSGLYSALTTSFFSQDVTRLEVCIRQGSPKDKDYAQRVMRLLQYPNLLIVTLNLGNVAAIVFQGVVLTAIISPELSVMVSVLTVFIFNKLLPQLIGDRYGLILAANMTWFVYVSIVGFFIIAWPIAMLLSVVMVKRKDRFYQRSELKTLVELQMTSPDALAEQKNLSPDEVLIIQGALDAESKVAKDAMIPLNEVSMLDYDGVFDHKTMKMLATMRFSHVPVFKDRRDNVQGEFVTKHLILLNPDDQEQISKTFVKYGRSLNYIPSTRPLYDIFDDMNQGRYRIAAVFDNDTGDVAGVITLQNVLDVILGQAKPLSRPDSLGKMKMVQSWKQVSVERRRLLSSSSDYEGLNFQPTESTPLIV